MRWPLAALTGCVVLVSIARADQTFPYKAFVTTDDVYIRSGPGENYYPTEKLKVGDEVEVYRHDPGGWYAIRPPMGSFSWISGRHVEFNGERVATVNEERLAARVGSRFSDIRDVIQVRLHRGEAVEVLDGKVNGRSNTSSTNTWYKIAPPAGEFRWVFGKFVDPNFPRDGILRTQAADPLDSASHDGLAIARVPTTSPSAEREGGQPVQRTISSEQFQKELNDVDVEISTIVIEEPSVWDFAELRQRSESLFNQAETAVERGRARMLLGKIARFDDIKKRYQAVGALQQDMARGDRESARLSKAALPPADPDGRFDARGQLARVTDPKPGAPQYVILDANGAVKCYVSPAPGINLRSSLGQQVGITGVRGFMPELKATHVMARHVSVVDGSAPGPTLR